ncbi:L-dopachrome tautomerase-related protein [Shewanella scandinavica]|uniref:L-dopachrome tautomerase-related protein n=1 Tax=Shewanella scandinavica TaxID=3063538 RepID=A0ABU3G373_9GAMM|nr:L-dopachrome tautomerase-related protein [Shewanella sp. SP2S1-2]MDT3282046.1 L-dopachrome tautomerase-related protein [Shewanella sp. SP2S1-2]
MTILSTRITYPMLSKAFTLLASSLLCSHSWATQTEPLAKMEVFAELDGAVGGITFTSDDRLIFSYHPFYQPNIKVAELLADGSTKPFPNSDWQQCHDPQGKAKEPDTCLNWVLGLRTDDQDRVWLLDSGQQAPRIEPKLVAWDTKKNQLDRIIHLPAPVSLPESQHNDFVISTRHQAIVIADEGIGTGPIGEKAALVVVDLNTGKSRRLLQGDNSVMPDLQRPLIIDKDSKDRKQIEVYVGADGIALDKTQTWLYFAPMNKDKVYRVRMTDLINPSLTPAALSAKVEAYADKPDNGGLSIDEANNLYLTEVGERAIGVIPADSRQYRTYVHDERMVWPDGVSYGKQGYLYSGAAQLPLSAPLNNGKAENSPPYYIFRFKPLAAGVRGN